MSKYLGTRGNVALGGVVTGSPLVQGATAQDEVVATFDAASLTGTILPGDTFTVAGDAQVYTITTGGAVGSVTPNELLVGFTPAVQPGAGWSDNAAVTFVSNSVANVVEWEAEASRDVLEVTVMQDTGQRRDLDTPLWKGRLVVMLDYDDARQAALVDQIVASGTASALYATLVVASAKNLWGALFAYSASITGRRGSMFEASITFEGEGALALDWA